jgi:hypothetical protein
MFRGTFDRILFFGKKIASTEAGTVEVIINSIVIC